MNSRLLVAALAFTASLMPDVVKAEPPKPDIVKRIESTQLKCRALLEDPRSKIQVTKNQRVGFYDEGKDKSTQLDVTVKKGSASCKVQHLEYTNGFEEGIEYKDLQGDVAIDRLLLTYSKLCDSPDSSVPVLCYETDDSIELSEPKKKLRPPEMNLKSEIHYDAMGEWGLYSTSKIKDIRETLTCYDSANNTLTSSPDEQQKQAEACLTDNLSDTSTFRDAIDDLAHDFYERIPLSKRKHLDRLYRYR